MCFPVCIFLHKRFLVPSVDSCGRFVSAWLFSVIACLASLPVMAEPVSVLEDYSFDHSAWSIELGAGLSELSGLACDDKGRLFAHNDEEGTVYELDPETGRVIKRFFIERRYFFGKWRIDADFEGIAIAGDRFFLVASDGRLFSFDEGADGTSVPAVEHDTFLHGGYDVEGLCYDPVGNELLLACKQWPGAFSLKEIFFDRKLVDQRKELKPVFSFSLDSMELEPTPRFVLDGHEIRELTGRKKFRPSAIETCSGNSGFLVVSSSAGVIAHYDPAGKLVGAKRLSSPPHVQPEGLTIDPQGRLFIGDEGTTTGRLTRYNME